MFAPTDEAFNDAGITVANVDELDEELLVNVLTYHVSPGRRCADSVIGAPRLPTLNGAFIEQENGVLNAGQASFVATNVEASNGVIYVIDDVLKP